ncbi:type II toxin-antitoxin system RelE/ParE family toxin [Candidatus Jidaibacter acanthamoebae]|nr:type II toxin-antitoxin system RelE/ParE family toxin [Candidatus Jidaibacter acanthamoeba]
MIKSFANSKTEALFNGKFVKQFSSFKEQAERKLVMIDAAHSLEDLKVPPGNRLEALIGDKRGFYSIRINDQWRICFRWLEGNAYQVEIIDYH